jgi:hypothetical protein
LLQLQSDITKAQLNKRAVIYSRAELILVRDLERWHADGQQAVNSEDNRAYSTTRTNVAQRSLKLSSLPSSRLTARRGALGSKPISLTGFGKAS